MPESGKRAAYSSRGLWSGTITFGLVSIPVDLFPAVHARATAMHMVDREGNPLGRQYYCPKHGKALQRSDLVRGVESRGGKYVAVADDELEEIAPEMSRDIELQCFVPLDQVAPKYFDHPYILTPAGRSTKGYYLLAKVISRSGRAGVGTFVMRGRQHLVAIVADGSILRAQTLRFAEELRSAAQVGLPEPRQSGAAAAKKLAAAIKSNTSRSLDTTEMSDRHAQALRQLAERKAKKGEDVVEPMFDRQDEDEPGDGASAMELMERLQQSLRGAKRMRSGSALGKPRKPAAQEPQRRKKQSAARGAMSRKALEAQARKLGIAGRSTMGKPALLAAIQRSG